MLLTYLLIKPLRRVAIFIFRHFVIHLYRIYFVIKKWLLIIFAPAKSKIIYPLLNKSTIHLVIIVIAVAVILNNFVIQETRAEEFGQTTILASLITDTQDIEIIETAITNTVKTQDYHKRIGMLSLFDASVIETSAIGGNESGILKIESSAALVRPGLAQTTTGDRARDDIEYYIVESGDTISTIAEKFKVTTNTLLWENKLGPRDYIKPGDKLTILPMSGVSYQIKSGDTLDKIADKYSSDVNKILDYNQLADASAISKDQIIIIPDGTMPAPPAPKVQTGSSSGFALFNIPASATVSGEKLQWPTSGRKISQYYKWRHYAIDIAGDYTSPTYAADDGRVEAVGWGRGYGNRIIIDHGNGIKTLYAHHSKMFVKTGDHVSRGQTIGMIGCTGWCTGPHVHFEVIVNGSKVNPLNYL